MRLFRYAQDYYGDWLAQQLLPAAAVLIILLAALFIGIHLLRRAWGEPVCSDQSPPESVKGKTIEKYEIGARLYHWGNFASLLVLAVSGVALFVPGSLKPVMVTWLRAHEIFAALFITGLVLHVVVATTRGEARSMWFERRDWRDIRLIFANFFGVTRRYPCFGKYDPWQKVYHAALTLVSLVLIFTGVYLFMSAEALATFSHPWMRWQRLLHDISAFVLIAVIVGHIYFGIIRVNWPALYAMFTGRISSRYFRLRHSTKRWRPKNIKQEQGGD